MSETKKIMKDKKLYRLLMEQRKKGGKTSPYKPLTNMKMNIDRDVVQGDLDTAIKRVTFCLDQLEKQGFSEDVSWETQITRRLTVEEIVGALVSAEQQLCMIKVNKNESKLDS